MEELELPEHLALEIKPLLSMLGPLNEQIQALDARLDEIARKDARVAVRSVRSGHPWHPPRSATHVSRVSTAPALASTHSYQVLAFAPDYPWGRALRAWALARSGRLPEAGEELGRVPDNDDELVLMTRAVVHHALGERADRERLIERLRRRASANPSQRQWLAWTLLQSGRVEEGLAELEQAFGAGGFQLPQSRTLFARDAAVRDHPRFQAFLRKMRLDDASLRGLGFPVPGARDHERSSAP